MSWNLRVNAATILCLLTFSIMIPIIMSFSIIGLSIITLRIMSLSIMTLSIKGVYVTVSIKDTKHK
jgi:hypothetical protein